jgi:hypothetical protein
MVNEATMRDSDSISGDHLAALEFFAICRISSVTVTGSDNSLMLIGLILRDLITSSKSIQKLWHSGILLSICLGIYEQIRRLKGNGPADRTKIEPSKSLSLRDLR